MAQLIQRAPVPAAVDELTVSTEPRNTAESHPQTERRIAARRQVRSLAYVDLGRDNGGIILNLSEGGLAIHSAAQLNEPRLPQIRFQLPQSSEWVEAQGKMAWTSESKMQAGIQLIGLAEPAREQIRGWVSANSRAASVPPGKQDGDRIAAPTPVPARPTTEVRGASDTGSKDAKARNSAAAYVPSAPVASPLQREPASATTTGSSGPTRNTHGRATDTELSLFQVSAEPSSRWTTLWNDWSGFIALVAVLAALSFFSGLAAGRGNFRRVFGLFSQRQAQAAPPQGSQQASATETIASTNTGRVAVTARLYVPVPIPARSTATESDRLQVGAVEYRVEPQYPPDAVAQQREGTVQLRATIGANGAVQSVSVLNGPADLAEAAKEAVGHWVFRPTLLDGKPVGTEADIAVVFWVRPSAAQSAQRTQ